MTACKRHSESPVKGYNQCAGCEIEALRAENGRLQADRDRANQYANQQALERNKLSTDLEAARGLLRECHSEFDTCEASGFEVRMRQRIAAFLTATPAPEVQAEQGERQEAVPEETPHIIVFDDTDRPNEVFSGAGARPAALRRWEQISVSWNAHLFVRVEKNSRDDPNPCARLATTPRPGPDVRALVEALEWCEDWFARHSPTFKVDGFFPTVHPMLTSIRNALAAHRHAQRQA